MVPIKRAFYSGLQHHLTLRAINCLIPDNYHVAWAGYQLEGEESSIAPLVRLRYRTVRGIFMNWNMTLTQKGRIRCMGRTE